MAKTSPGFYALPRDASESNRLNRQHQLYITSVGFFLHPRIEASLPANARIADVATGTGIWLRELAARSPSTWTFTGFDISSDQIPKDEEHSFPNIEYRFLNILKPIPEDLKGQYDAVHLRLLCGALQKPEDWVLAARNMKDLLKGGGHLQWHEPDAQRQYIWQTVPGASSHHCSLMLDIWRKSIPGRGLCPEGYMDSFPTYLRNAGFEHLDVDVISSDRVADTRALANDVQFGALHTLAKMAIRDKWVESDLTIEMVEEIWSGVKAEIEDVKVYMQWPMHVAIARKPKEEVD